MAENSEGRIVYDDRAIEALLDRSQEGIIEKESGMDDYLSSFKVSFICFLNFLISNIFIYFTLLYSFRVLLFPYQGVAPSLFTI